MRHVAERITAKSAPVGDLVVLRALPTAKRRSVGPFVFLDHFGPFTVKPGPGIPAHPHAGIEVITYLFEGEQVHRDSLGNESRVGAGGAQWITAGRGIIHAEKPEPGVVLHGVQMWTSLPRARKLVEPRYRAVQAEEILVVDLGGARLRLVAGTLEGSTGPVVLAQPALLAHVIAEANVELKIDAAFELAIYRFNGALEVLSAGESVMLDAGEYILFGGAPAEGPLLFGGPFVMDSEERLAQAQLDYLRGRMGTLDGVPY